MTINYIDLKRKINLPSVDTGELSEFFGILTGDGYMGKYRNNHVIEIAGNSIKDKDYMENYVSNLFNSLFNIKPNINFRKDQNTMYLRLQSRSVLEYLKNKEFKEGLKGRIKIPKWVKQNENLMIPFVRGFFDTDGCISFKKKEGKLYPSISIGSKSDFLLKDIKSFIDKKGISSYFATIKHKGKRYKAPFQTYQLQINGYKNILLWFQVINSSNKRNIDRFHEMIKLRLLKEL